MNELQKHLLKKFDEQCPKWIKDEFKIIDKNIDCKFVVIFLERDGVIIRAQADTKREEFYSWYLRDSKLAEHIDINIGLNVLKNKEKTEKIIKLMKKIIKLMKEIKSTIKDRK